MPLTLSYVMRIDVEIGPVIDVGPVPNGYRRILPIIGGTFEGERLRGTIIPGGADWNMVRSDELMTVSAEYLVRTDDGVHITINNQGMMRATPGRMAEITDGALDDTASLYTRLVSRYEAPAGKYAWLNTSIFLGLMLPPKDMSAISVEIYELD